MSGTRASFVMPGLAPWLPGGHAQTIYPVFFAQKRLNGLIVFRRQRLELPDGDFLDIDWVDAEQAMAPTMVLFHGLEGSSASGYAQALASVCRHRGWRCAVVHFRGCSGEINRGPRAYYAGDIGDVEAALTSIRQTVCSGADAAVNRGPITAVGVSLGGNALSLWASQRGSKANQWIDSLVSVSAPFDLAASGLAIDRGLNRSIYARLFLSTMKRKAWLKAQQYPGLFDLPRVLAANTLRVFDDAFTAPLHGFSGVDDYWARASAKSHLSKLSIPSLLINARNDPLVPADSLPIASDLPAAVQVCQPEAGGHVGFMAPSTLGLPGEVTSFAQSLCRWAAETWPRS
ncbi:MAG: YheT family hydrolase [Burkholderiaceae bacterium]